MSFTYNVFINVHLSVCRRISNEVDLWNNLQNNWDNFFWLTGEIPTTLMSIVEAIRPRCMRYHMGRTPKLSLHNQVNMYESFRIFPSMKTSIKFFGII